jgi:hypothetical protein
MADNPHSPTEPAGEIRAGVFRPDWTTITSAGARTALAGRMAARSGLLDKWSQQLGTAEDCVWRAILRLYADRGRPPEADDIVAETGIAADEVKRLFHSLAIKKTRDYRDINKYSVARMAFSARVIQTRRGIGPKIDRFRSKNPLRCSNRIFKSAMAKLARYGT